MKSRLTNENGVTLVELLATIVLISLISALSFTVLFQGYSNYQRIKVEAELRDEADLIMASLISDLFVAKKTELELVQSCKSGKVESYVKVSKESGEKYETGFRNNQAIVKGQTVQFYNNSVNLVAPTCTGGPSEVLNSHITSADDVAYTVNFTLETLKNNRKFTKKFSNTIVVVDN